MHAKVLANDQNSSPDSCDGLFSLGESFDFSFFWESGRLKNRHPVFLAHIVEIVLRRHNI
jgi:hypothetical protein